MKLSLLDFKDKYVDNFAPNNEGLIKARTFQDFTEDITDTFGNLIANVPAYLAGTEYRKGDLIRFQVNGGLGEQFWYALRDGQLPAPNNDGTKWRLTEPPRPAPVFYELITLGDASSIEAASVQPGRRYGVLGKWNESTNDQLVVLDGLESYFRRRGTLLRDNGSQQEVDADVIAGRYVPIIDYSTHSTTDSNRSTGPIMLFARPRYVEVVPIDNVQEVVVQVSVQDTKKPGKWKEGTPTSNALEVQQALEEASAAQYALGVQVRFQTTPQQAAEEANFRLDGMGAGFYPGDKREFLGASTAEPANNVLKNPKFTEPIATDQAQGWAANDDIAKFGVDHLVMRYPFYGGATPEDCLQEVELSTDMYRLRFNVTKIRGIGNYWVEVKGQAAGSIGYDTPQEISQEGEVVFDFRADAGQHIVHFYGGNVDIAYCYLYPPTRGGR